MRGRLSIALVLMLAGCVGRTRAVAPAAPRERVGSTSSHAARVAGHLRPRVQIKGEEGPPVSLQERMRALAIPTVSIAVFERHRLAWAEAFGVADETTGAKADQETLFLAGSISKSVNALAVMQAAKDGALSLDGPVNERLSSWKLPENDWTRKTPVTLRMLLSHTAGTTVHGFAGYAVGDPLPTIEQILDGLPPANNPPVRVDMAPGTKFRYSGGGTTIAQLALVDAEKRPYPDILESRVFRPLEMRHSSYEQSLSPARLAHAALGHDAHGRPIPGKRHVYPEMAAAGLWTTPSDLAQFFSEIGLARRGRSSRISREIAHAMTTPVIDVSPPIQSGLGVFLSERHGAKLFGHDGIDAGFQATALASLDDGYGVVVMASSDNGTKIFDEVVRTVFAEHGFAGADPVFERYPMTAQQLARFTGRFVDGSVPLEISIRQGRLESRSPLGNPAEEVPFSQKAIVNRESGRILELDARGELVDAGRPIHRIPNGKTHPLFVLETGTIEEAAKLWRAQAQEDQGAALADEKALNLLAYRSMDDDLEGATRLLALIAAAFPESSNAHDSYAEALLRKSDKARALAEYELSLKTLDADPRIPAGEKEARRDHARAQLDSLRAAQRP